MAINEFTRAALRAISYPDISIKKSYCFERELKSIGSRSLLSPLYKLWDRKITVDGRDIPVRIYQPPVPTDENCNGLSDHTLIFFHGGGWVKETVDTYNKVCMGLARHTGANVVSVEYRLAPEHKFPMGLMDCYAAARELYLHPDTLGVFSDNYTLMGDSAGANLAAAVSLMARDKGEFTVQRQILVYPATHYDHSETSPFPSVRENGCDYLLTAKRINEYTELYRRSEADLQNPYFSPLLADVHHQPDTLLITAEFDPLRDEGEAYGDKLRAAGNRVLSYRMRDALHGFLSLPPRFVHVKRTYALINSFLNEEQAYDIENHKGLGQTR
jgi:acetyl esterase